MSVRIRAVPRLLYGSVIPSDAWRASSLRCDRRTADRASEESLQVAQGPLATHGVTLQTNASAAPAGLQLKLDGPDPARSPAPYFEKLNVDKTCRTRSWLAGTAL